LAAAAPLAIEVNSTSVEPESMKTLLATLLVALAFVAAASAQSSAHYRIAGAALSSGGVTAATGGHYSIAAVAGQPAPGLASAANYRLEAGALPAASTVSACGPLAVALAGDSVVVTWPAGLGWVLETATSLHSPSWTTVPPQSPGGMHVVSLGGGERFFRLRAP
jgi:hypothetical protein